MRLRPYESPQRPPVVYEDLKLLVHEALRRSRVFCHPGTSPFLMVMRPVILYVFCPPVRFLRVYLCFSRGRCVNMSLFALL